MHDLYSLVLATNTNTYETIADDSYIGWAALDHLTDWDSKDQLCPRIATCLQHILIHRCTWKTVVT